MYGSSTEAIPYIRTANRLYIYIYIYIIHGGNYIETPPAESEHDTPSLVETDVDRPAARFDRGRSVGRTSAERRTVAGPPPCTTSWVPGGWPRASTEYDRSSIYMPRLGSDRVRIFTRCCLIPAPLRLTPLRRLRGRYRSVLLDVAMVRRLECSLRPRYFVWVCASSIPIATLMDCGTLYRHLLCVERQPSPSRPFSFSVADLGFLGGGCTSPSSLRRSVGPSFCLHRIPSTTARRRHCHGNA